MTGRGLPTNNRHVKETDLESYSMHALSPEASARVEEHLLICETCRGRLMEADEYTAAMKDAARHLPRQEPAAEPSRWRWRWPRLILAVAAVALIGIGVVALPPARHATSAPFAVSLQTMRGPQHSQAPSRRPLALQLDLTGLAASPAYRIEMVDQSGHRVWQGTIVNPVAAASITVPPQKRGMYFVRVALPSGEALREYGLEIRGTD
jgi:predicted anti-sigma-YlaC factor YlaD